MEQDEPNLHFREFSLWVRGYDCPTCDPSKNFWGANRLVVEAKIHTANSYAVLEPSSCLNTNEVTTFLERLEGEVGTETSEDWEVHLNSFEDELDWCVYRRGGGLFLEIKIDISAVVLFEKHVVKWKIGRMDLDKFLRQLNQITSQFPARGVSP